MTLRPILRVLFIAGAITLAAMPVRAQPLAGPVRSASLDGARLETVTIQRSAATHLPGSPSAAEPSPGLLDPPDVSKPRLYQSAPLSALMSTGGAILGYGLAFVLLDCSDEGPECNAGPDNSEYIGGYAGMVAGAAIGAHLGGRRGDSQGHFPATLLGAAVGGLPLVFADKENVDGGTVILSLVTTPLAAVLSDYLVRSPRSTRP